MRKDAVSLRDDVDGSIIRAVVMLNFSDGSLRRLDLDALYRVW